MKPGQKVVCIDDKNQKKDFIRNIDYVVELEIYTVRGITMTPDEDGIYGLFLEEVVGGYEMGVEIGYKQSRFRLVDYNFGENILSNIEELELIES